MSAVDLFKAALDGQALAVASLLQTDPSLAQARDPNSDHRTALHHAATSGSLETVQALTLAKADLNAADGMGFTPLISAVSSGKVDVVKELIGSGADVQAKNARDQTALHYAASKGWVEIGKLLIQKGADINARDKANQLPLHRAASTGSTAFINLLLNPPVTDPPQPKLRLNLLDRAGNTPLHLAIESGHAEAAVALIEGGADRHRTNAEGERAEELSVSGPSELEWRRMKQFIVSRCGPLE